MRAVTRPLLTALALVSLGALGGACNLIAGVPSLGDEGGGTTCATDEDCDDGEPCTSDACVESSCRHAAVDDGPIATLQKAGACRRITCVSGESFTEDDDTNIPDDQKDCTLDACFEGSASHVPKPIGTTCDDGAGHSGYCDAQGECRQDCVVAADCALDPPNPCVVPTCDGTTTLCSFPPVLDGTPTPGATQAIGDCQVRVCIGGVDTKQVDPSDVNVTASDCDIEACNDGAPSNAPRPEGAPCSTFGGDGPGFCDGAGACKQCANDSDCGGTIDDCKRPACVSGACTTAFTPAMTETTGAPPQVPGDCRKIVCDGAGGTTTAFDATDPLSDGNTCTSDVCASPGVTTHPDAPGGTSCGAGGALTCSSGECVGCTASSQCGVGSCNGTVLIKAPGCDLNGAVCVPPSPATQDCAPYLCSNANGGCTTSCTVDAECSQAGVGAYCASTTCHPKLGNGSTCAGNSTCQSGFCVDSVCCSSTCSGACQACSAAKKGGGASGVCGSIANGTDPDNECAAQSVTSCGNDGYCNGAGACRKHPAGITCRPAAGGCDVAETCPGNGAACPADALLSAATVCRSASGACDVAEVCSGTSASCPPDGFVSQGSADPPLCSGVNVCDGGGTGLAHCKLKMGESCTLGAECASGVCDVGVCF